MKKGENMKTTKNYANQCSLFLSNCRHGGVVHSLISVQSFKRIHVHVF